MEEIVMLTSGGSKIVKTEQDTMRQFVREFKLISDTGQTFDLMDFNSYCFFSNPSGLGYSYSIDYRSLDGFYVIDKKILNQQCISGTLNFKNYDNYTKFVKFIEQSNELKIEYSIPYENEDKKIFYRDITLSDLSKDEKDDSSGILICSVTFDALSLWYSKDELTYAMDAVDNEIRWDFQWNSFFNSYSNREVTILNDGDIDASIELRIPGEVDKPKISLYVNDEFKQSLKVPITINENESFNYSSKNGNCYIYKKETDGSITNLKTLDYLDIYNDNCIRLEKNKNNKIILQAGNDDTDEITSALLIVYKYYKSV